MSVRELPAVQLRAGALTAADVRALLRHDATLVLDPSARRNVDRAAAVVAAIAERDASVYGINTGFGKLAQTRIPREKLADLLHGAGIDPQRLAQEAAILADRSDISEELARLRTHAGQLEQILSGGGEIGKRLDFLLQEMNREANTILSKTGGLGDIGLTITELALAAKSEIDKIREQSLNLE